MILQKVVVNPIMMSVGDAIALNDTNTEYTKATTPSILSDDNDNEVITENTNQTIDVTTNPTITTVEIEEDT